MVYNLDGNKRIDFWKRVSFYVSVASVTILVCWVFMTFILPPSRDPNLNTINRVANNKTMLDVGERLDEMDLQIHKLQIGQELLYQWIKEQQAYNKGRVKFIKKGGE